MSEAGTGPVDLDDAGVDQLTPAERDHVRQMLEVFALSHELAVKGWNPTEAEQAELDTRMEQLKRLGPASPAVWAVVERELEPTFEHITHPATDQTMTPAERHAQAEAIRADCAPFQAKWLPGSAQVVTRPQVATRPIAGRARPRERQARPGSSSGSGSRASPRPRPPADLDDDPDPPGPDERKEPAPVRRCDSVLDELQDVLARVVFCREAVELGEYALAAAILSDFEDDLAAALSQLEAAA